MPQDMRLAGLTVGRELTAQNLPLARGMEMIAKQTTSQAPFYVTVIKQYCFVLVFPHILNAVYTIAHSLLK
jgi:hypothetical protein